MELSIGVLGCGTMGKCILSGLFDSGSVQVSRVYASVSSDGSAASLKEEYPLVNVTLDNREVVERCDFILLCVKPQVALSVLEELGPLFRGGKKLVSICAGVTVEAMRGAIGVSDSRECLVVRAMPNTPCRIRQGMIVLSNSFGTHSDVRQLCVSIFTPLGRVRVVDEKHFDAVTALSGSGPAFAW